MNDVPVAELVKRERECLSRDVDDVIPKTFHQTWKNGEVPRAFTRMQQSWLLHNPDWEYRFWTDASARRLVAEHYAWFLPVYDAYVEPIKRVDAVRYLWLHHFGGVYVDLDFECLRPLVPLLSERRLVLGCEPDEHLRPWVVARGIDRIVCNAFMASVPGHPFWEFVVRRLEASRYLEPLSATGPFFLSRAVADYAEREQLTIVGAEALYPATKGQCWAADGDSRKLRLGDAFAVHHFLGTWCREGLLDENENEGDGDGQRTGEIESAGSGEPVRPAGAAPRVLIATPLKNARLHLPRYLQNLFSLAHPSRDIAIAFVESDSEDETWEVLGHHIGQLRARFGRVHAYKHDFGVAVATSPDRPDEVRRRAVLAGCRNFLLRALGDADWVLWLDVDVDYPPDILERLLAANRDIVAPHCVGADGRTRDRGTFMQVGGERRHLGELRDQPLAPLSSVGSTMLLVRADLHRQGLVFPGAADISGDQDLAAIAEAMGYPSWGLPGVEVVHR